MNTNTVLGKMWNENNSTYIKPTKTIRKIVTPIIKDSSISEEYFLIQAQENLNQALLLNNIASHNLNKISKNTQLLKKIRESFGIEELDKYLFSLEEDPSPSLSKAAGTTPDPVTSGNKNSPVNNPTNPQNVSNNPGQVFTCPGITLIMNPRNWFVFN